MSKKVGGALTLIEPYVNQVALQMPEFLSFTEWEKIGNSIRLMGQCVLWILGDWINFGEYHFKEKAIQVAEMTGYSPGTIANASSVCKRIEPERRVPGLSFEHHKEVYILDPHEQAAWLKKAEKGEWTRNELRLELKKAGARKRQSKKEDTSQKKNGLKPMLPVIDLYGAFHNELYAAMNSIPALAELGTGIEQRWHQRMPTKIELDSMVQLITESRDKMFDLLTITKEILGVEE